MRVLITGGSGLVGSHLARQLVRSEHEVYSVTRTDDGRAAALRASGAHVIVADMASSPVDDIVQDHRFDHVVYLAQSARFREFPGGANDMVQVNVAGAVRLAQWSAEHAVSSFVYASTGAVYGPSTTPHREVEPVAYGSLGMYAASKAAGESVIASFSALMRIVLIRPFFVYGPGMNETMLINSLINSVRDRAAVKLFGHVDGLCFQPIFAADAASQVAALLEGPLELVVVNIVGDVTFSLRAVAEQIGELVGVAPLFDHVPGARQAVLGDGGLIQSIAGPCRTGLAEGLRAML